MSETAVSLPDTALLSPVFNPALLKAARQIYRTYYEVHPEDFQRPVGIAISTKTHRGKLIFGERPILLPSECFIPLNQIEPGLH
ncbi:hypothetical protein GFS31_18310 [Leptolyngbya sp. BL0902]|uniref:hypothetical protein n=1 Tax=Leptolyngbya sp. BL0902 TaxID=1115757 RepID=UPI0018E86A35|nr:hypothetical protein [Leptolyngbya sp. BL0902]QQE65146.1 hypothetical protein GFS31_18310 [Leptolyngbya sp. BL0902]